MKAKEYLYQIPKIHTKIQNKKERIAHLTHLLQTPAVQSYQPDKVRTSVSTDKMGRMIAEKITLEEELQRLLYQEAELIIRIGRQIDGLSKPEHSRLLHLKYEEHMTLREIASVMNYEYITIRKMHGAALKAFTDMYQNSIH